MGTGVKKGYLVGGVEKKDDFGGGASGPAEGGGEEKERVRTFCIEWSGM